MNIAVCVKQIPDPATPYELDAENHWVVRPNDQVLDDTDRFGIEIGLQLAEASEGTVTLYSMGPSGSLQGIRQALAMGADKAVLIDDDSLQGSDALTTSRILAAAIDREGFDLVIAGMESTDGFTGVVPQMISEILDVPCLSFARKVDVAQDGEDVAQDGEDVAQDGEDVAEGGVTIERQTATGYEVVSSPLPALLGVTAGVVEPRYPTFKGIMAAKSKPVDTLTAADLGVEPYVGQTVTSVTNVEAREAGDIVEDEGEAYLKIVELLEETKVI